MREDGGPVKGLHLFSPLHGVSVKKIKKKSNIKGILCVGSASLFAFR